jgi:ribose transport system ATP-binding protein
LRDSIQPNLGISNMSHVLQMTGISKRFPGVVALDDVEFSVDAAEVVALVGENGAGKSTLMKILAGIHQPDSGVIHVEGTPVSIRSPREAARLGVGVIHQELEVIDTLDVAGNIFLGREPAWGGPLRFLDRKKIYSDTERCLARIGLDVAPTTLLQTLSAAQQQLVEIARALSQNARLLIMDEPTSSLTQSECERLYDVVKDLRRSGVSVIYITHRLREVEVLADRVAVLRDGKNAGELRASEISRDPMVRLMVGRDLDKSGRSAKSLSQEPALEVRDLRTDRYPAQAVSLAVRKGEILGLAGLIGAGRSELAQAIFGVSKPVAGTVVVAGEPMEVTSPQLAIRRGIYLVPEDRRHAGLVTAMTVRENMTLPSLERYSSAGWIHRDLETRATQDVCSRLNIKTPSIETAAADLSGGNQQKVVLGKWLSMSPKVILFDEPTRGIDVGAKREIYALMRELAGRGTAILMISSDMEEILANSDRVAVMHEGRITGILERSDCTEEAIMRLAVA